VENGTVFHYSIHAVILNYRMQARSCFQTRFPSLPSKFFVI